MRILPRRWGPLWILPLLALLVLWARHEPGLPPPDSPVAPGEQALPTRRAALDTQILDRSHRIVRDLTELPPDRLTTEQRLLLLHATYNTGDYPASARMGRALGPALRSLPRERRQAFLDMILDSMRRLGRSEEADAYRRQFGEGR